MIGPAKHSGEWRVECTSGVHAFALSEYWIRYGICNNCKEAAERAAKRRQRQAWQEAGLTETIFQKLVDVEWQKRLAACKKFGAHPEEMESRLAVERDLRADVMMVAELWQELDEYQPRMSYNQYQTPTGAGWQS